MDNQYNITDISSLAKAIGNMTNLELLALELNQICDTNHLKDISELGI